MPKPGLDTTAIGRCLGDILQHLDGSRALEDLATLLATLVPADDVTLLLFRRDQPPQLVLDLSVGPASSANLGLYLKGAYLLDPYYRAYADGVAPGCYRLQQLAPAAFRSSEYFRLHFGRTGFSDEIAYLLPAAPGACAHLSLGVRNGRFRYTKAQQQRLNDFLPFVLQLLSRHTTQRETAEPTTLTTQLDSALKFFGRDFLTEREAEVMQLLLRGHSTKSIAERLRISPETVKLHRKHSYAKLDVSSQAELFHLFIDALGSLGSYRGGDPLSGYLNR